MRRFRLLAAGERLSESRFLILLIFALIFLVRFIYLDADPSFVKRLSDIADETVWGLDARNALLFGDWFIGDLHVGLDSAPLYMYLLYLFFKLFGPALLVLRLLPALSGFSTAVLLYFFVRKLTDHKQALLTLCLFGFGNVVVVYHRLGHLESTLTLFLLAVFVLWFYGKKHWSLYFLSGIFYGLAVLIKASALLFFPALLFYWFFEWKKEQLKLGDLLKKMVYFSLGAIVPILLYLYLFLIPHWSKISGSLWSHGKNNFFGFTLPLNAFKVLGNNLFGLPTFTLLFFLFIFYLLWKLNRLEKLSVTELIGDSTPVEFLALSWLWGGLAGILISDISDRRFTIMFVPLVILIAHLVAHFQEFSLRELVSKISLNSFRPTWSSKFFYFLFLLLPAFSLPYLILRLMGKDSLLFKQGSIIILVGYAVTISFLFFIEKAVVNQERKVFLNKFLLFQFVFFLLFGPAITLIRHFSRHFSIIFSVIAQEKVIIVGATATVFSLLLVFFLLKWKDKNLWLRKSLLRSGLIAYFTISGILVGNIVFFPDFTIMDGVKELAGRAVPGSMVMGAAVEELLYGTDLLYLKYEPTHRIFYSVNKDIWNYQPRYYLYAKVFDGHEHNIAAEEVVFEEVKARYDLTLLGVWKLYRYPLTSKYKAEFELYELAVKGNESAKGVDVGLHHNDDAVTVSTAVSRSGSSVAWPADAVIWRSDQFIEGFE